MTEMVERVARAIVAELEDQQLGTQSSWGDPEFRDNALRCARSAIKVMREPTEGMVFAAQANADANDATAAIVWQAMIDEALS